jgi:predicted DsbA family dithiol-disulfide isomerase
MRPLHVQVWSDVACPWCYVGKRRLEAAIARAPSPPVEVVWRSFELDPAAPRVQPPAPYADRLAAKYRTTVERAREMIDRMAAVGAADGLSLRFDRIRPGNTFDAHRLLHLARERGVQGAVKERLLRAYLTDGEAIGEPEVLARVAAEAGLDPGEARQVLSGEEYASAVRADEDEARRLGIHAVPFFVLAGRYGVAGAQPVEALREALARAAEETAVGAGEPAAACGRDGGG